MLTDDLEEFYQEKADIITAGLQSTRYQHLDDTGARVNGKNHYTHILCNPFYTAYFTVPRKDRHYGTGNIMPRRIEIFL